MMRMTKVAAISTVCLLGGLSAAPCQGQIFVILQEIGNPNRVTTKNSFSPPPYNWLNLSTYKLQGEVRVGQRENGYETPFEKKLSIFQLPAGPPLAVGTQQREGRSIAGAGNTYVATASSGIETEPLGIGLTIGPVDAGIVFGVQATLEVEAKIEPIDPDPQGNPVTFAQAFVHDPFFFENFAPDDALSLFSSLRAGDSFFAQGDGGSLLNSLVVSTDIPGLETLYRLDILAAGTGMFTGTAADTTVQVRFAAHPLLSLSDTEITQAVLNAITFDDAAERFVFTSDVSLFDGSVQIPDHVRDFHLFLTQSATSTDTLLALPPVSFGSPSMPVPEPSSFVLMLAGVGVAACLFVFRRQ